jgi:hypothetical protein
LPPKITPAFIGRNDIDIGESKIQQSAARRSFARRL